MGTRRRPIPSPRGSVTAPWPFRSASTSLRTTCATSSKRRAPWSGSSRDMDTPGIVQDAWLAEIMGRPVFLVDLGVREREGATWEAVSAHLASSGRAFSYGRVDAARVDAARRLA